MMSLVLALLFPLRSGSGNGPGKIPSGDAPMVFDLHCDTLYQNTKKPLDIVKNDVAVDLQKMRKGNYLAQVFAIWVPPAKGWKMVEEMASAFWGWKTDHAHDLALAVTGSQVLKARGKGQVAGILGIEGLAPLDGDAGKIDDLFNFGVRVLGLTWFNSNDFAGSSNSKDKLGSYGLTQKGKQLVERANTLGMVIDVSHASDQTVRDVAELSRDPFIASHSCARGIMDIERNLSDDLLRLIAGKGGVIGVNFHRGYLSPKPRSQVKLAEVVDQIIYISKVAGIDHVALGSDFDGSSPPEEINSADDMQSLAAALLKRGFSLQDVDKIMALNALRVFTAVTEKKNLEAVLSHVLLFANLALHGLQIKVYTQPRSFMASATR
jgi:membrane dipeptidase